MTRYLDITENLLGHPEGAAGPGRRGGDVLQQRPRRCAATSRCVFDVSSIPESEKHAAGRGTDGVLVDGFGALNVADALADAGPGA